jgi:hypothetical protein
MELDNPRAAKEEKVKKSGYQPIRAEDFRRGLDLQNKALTDQIDVTMRTDIAKILQEEYKLEIKDWKPWRDILYAHSYCVKEAYWTEIMKVIGDKASEQLHYLANWYQSQGK